MDGEGHQDPFYRKQPSSSTYTTYFREHAIRVGSQRVNFGGGGRVGSGMFRGPLEMREAIQREREKDRIRAEILAEEEMARRRILEAEVRNELRMEREMMAMRSGISSHSNFEPRILHRQPIGLEERIGMSLEEKYNKHLHGGNRFAFRGFEASPSSFQWLRESPKIDERVPMPLSEDTKKEVILLDGDSLSGTKRKSVSGDSSKPRSDGSRKKLKEEWSCAICQVSATSERGLTEHLQGKKHQSKEAALIAQKSGGNVGLGVSPKKPVVKPVTKLALTTTMTPSSSDKKSKRRKNSRKETSSSFSEVKKEEDGRKKKSDKFKFWCEMCEVGAFSEKVMNHHKEGKRHLTKLVKLLQKGKAEESETSKVVVGDDDGSSNMVVVKEVKQDDDDGSSNMVEEKSEVKEVMEDASIYLMGL